MAGNFLARAPARSVGFTLIGVTALGLALNGLAQSDATTKNQSPPAPVASSDALPRDPEHVVTERTQRAFGPEVREPPVAPVLLMDELSRVRETKIDIAAERKAIEEDRRGLEKIQAEIAEARASLKVEAARLQELIENTQTEPAREQAEESRAQVAKAMRKMKPKKLATLLVKLERPVAIDLLRQMKPKEAVALLEQLPPEQAASFAAELLAAQGGGEE